ncbi:MAG: septum formation initiator family protein [bacterium]|nr:septum formation initiator family protein [bacterium]
MSGRSQKGYWLSLVVVCALAAGYAYHRDLYGLYLYCRSSEDQVLQLDRELRGLEQDEARLQRRVKGLDNDPVEIEAAIRRNKNLVREGEKVYRIELEPDSAPRAEQREHPEADTRNSAQ